MKNKEPITKKITRSLTLVLLLASCLLLCACGKAGGASEKTPAEPTPAPTPAPVRFAGGEVEPGAQTLRMALAAGETALLDSLPALQSADLSGSAGEEEVAAWAAAHPGVAVRYTVTLPNGTVLDTDTESADLSGMSAADAENAARKLALLPGLKNIRLGSEGGAFTWSDIARLRQILPAPAFDYAFKLYGVDCNLSDTTINLFRVQVPDDGRLADEVIGYMPQLTYVDMDSCGLQPRRLEEINLNHPGVKVVFRVFFGDNYTARTDTERILASMASRGGMITPYNDEGLSYCHDVKYLDLGHNTDLTDISFVAQMPKLEVAILSMCNFSDTTPFANCPNLEYLEIANTYASDLRPLAGLTNLRHLNVAGIGYDQPNDGSARIRLTDITPLYNLTQLERLWIGGFNPVPPEQVAEMQRRAPQCEIDVSVYEDPVGGRWRYVNLADYINTYVDTLHERYAKLRQQFGDYDYSVYNFTWNDPLYNENYVPASTAVTPTPAPTPAPQTAYQPSYEQTYYPADDYYSEDPYYETESTEPDPYYTNSQEIPQNLADIILQIQGQVQTIPGTGSETQDQSSTGGTEQTQTQTETRTETQEQTQTQTVPDDTEGEILTIG